MAFDEAMACLRGMTSAEVRAFMRARLAPGDAETFDVFTENLTHEVLVFVSARTLARQRAAEARTTRM